MGGTVYRLLTILDDLHLARPAVVGMDMGGQPALAFASMFPERIKQLVVMNSLVFGDESTSWEIRLLRHFGFNRFALRTLPGLIFRRAQQTFLKKSERIDEPLRQDFWNAFSSPEVRRFISKMSSGYQGTLDQLPRLYASIRCPTLILWAENDKHFPIIQATRLHQTIPGSTLEIVVEGTHWMPISSPEQLAESIARFHCLIM